MVLAEKVVELMKTRAGKIFAALLALSIVFAFSSIAYGTSEDESSMDVADVTAESDMPLPKTDGVSEDGDEAVLPDDEDGEVADTNVVEDAVAPVAEELLENEQQMRQVPDANAQIAFGLTEGSHATVTSPSNDSIALDAPFIYEPQTPYVFRVVPDAGYEIESVEVVSKPTTERTVQVPVETPVSTDNSNIDASGDVQGEDEGIAEDPDIEAMSALGDEAQDNPTSEGTDEVVVSQDEGSNDVVSPLVSSEEEILLIATNSEMDSLNPFAMSYQIDLSDLASGAVGHDVAVVITTKELKFDAWWKIVEALGAGMDVKLGTDDKHGNITIGQTSDDENLTSWQRSDNNRQAVVRPSADGKTDIVLDLNGYQIVAESQLSPSVDSLITVSAGATLTIEDKTSAKPLITGSSSEGTLYDGALHADRVGKTAEITEDAITYYVTLSEPIGSGATDEVLYTQTIQVPTQAGKITSSVTDIKNLISVSSGAIANVNGGIFTNSAGRAIANNAGTLNMVGGMIFACNLNQDSGAGIYTAGGSTTVAGDAVIAGNKVDGGGSSWKGGGISVAGGTLSVSGNALVVGNSTQGAYMASDVRNYNPDGTGGGIFASAGSVSISGNSRIASNQAIYYGGGINIESGASLSISQGAVVSQNSTVYAHEGAQNQDWRYKTLGGGGVHSLGNVTISGGQITGNTSADGGGGILSPNSTATFNMRSAAGYDAIIASNYAKLSEGGGVYLLPAAGSKITSGYVTNNATDTPYDFGGGGIYIANESKDVEVWHPIVTNNTAMGYGGGVANCQNGITVSDKAGIFDNQAFGESLSNSSVEVDHWVKEQLNLPIESVQDFVGGKRSEIYSEMLGGGLYNWTGYMSYQPAANNVEADHTVEISQQSWSVKSIIVDGTTMWRSSEIGGLTRQPSGYYQVSINSKYMSESAARSFNDTLNGSAVSVFRDGVIEKSTGISANYYGPKDDKADEFGDASYKLIKDGNDYWWYFAFTLDQGEWGDLNYTKDIWSKRPTNSADANDEDWAKRDLLYAATEYDADGNAAYAPTQEGIEPYGTVLEAAKTVTTAGVAEIVRWPIAHITQFPDDGFAWSNRLMCLTAAPSDEDKANAMALGSLFITGNYSATNGGGIANNGNITIGEDPRDPYIPEEPVNEYINQGELDIVKIVEDAVDADMYGSVLATFSVAQYANREAFNTGNATMEDIVAFTFTESGSQTYKWPADVRAGNIFVISEIDIEGDNAVDDIVTSNTKVIEVSYTASEVEDIVDEEGNVVGTKTTYKPIALAEFLNRFAPESFMTGVINHYVKGDAGFTFTQGFSRASSASYDSDLSENAANQTEESPEPDTSGSPEGLEQSGQN